MEYNDFPLPPDYQEKTEWAFARLMYPQGALRRFRISAAAAATGPRATPCGPRIIRAPTAISLQAMRRLTRIHVRSVEQPVNLEDGDDVYNWPWLYAVQVGEWRSDGPQAKQAARLSAARRLLHGRRFLGRRPVGELHVKACSACSGPRRWWICRTTIRFFTWSTIWTIATRCRRALRSDRRDGKCDGCPAHWRGIYDDKGRFMVAVTSIPISAIPGSGRWHPGMTRKSPPSGYAWASTISFTP